MLFRFLRVIVGIGFWLYFRKVEVIGKEHLSKDRPLIIPSNHPSSFMEACVLGIFLPVIVHFMTRGDVFEGPFKKFLYKTNQIPIFRARDGMESLRKNIESFKYTYKKLRKGERIVIFCEGTTKLVKRLRPVRKGTARMVYGFLDEYPDSPLLVNPIGVNFHDLSYFRSTVVIKIGAPINPKQYNHLDKIEKFDNITEDIYTSLKNCVIHIEKPKDHEWVDVFLHVQHDLNLYRRSKWSVMYKKPQKLIDGLQDHSELKDKATAYSEFCDRHKFKIGPHFKNPGFLRVVSYAIVLLGAIPAILVFTPVYKFASQIAKTKFKEIEFKHPVKAGLLIFISYFVIGFLSLLFLFFSWKLMLIFWGILLLSTYAYVKLIDFWNLYQNSLKVSFSSSELREESRSRYNEMVNLIENIME